MDKSFFIKQLDEIINAYNEVSTLAKYKSDLSDINEHTLVELIVRSKAAIVRIAGEKSEYYKQMGQADRLKGWPGKQLKEIMGSVIALKADLESDYLKNLSEIIHSDVFSDFLEMAEYLLSEGYKDAAAVIAGSTLEEHLRKVCIKHSISVTFVNSKDETIPKKADALNAELASADAYSKIDQKQVTAWLGIRNDAAHGNYVTYTSDQVKLMISGIIEFISRNSA